MPRPFALLCLVSLLVLPSCIGCSKRSAKPHQGSKVASSEKKRAAMPVGASRVPPNATPSDGDAGASDPDAGRPTTLDVSSSSDVAASLVTPSWHRPGYTPPAIIDFHGHLGLAGAERIKRVMHQNGVELIINLSGGSGRRKGVGWQYGMALAQALDGRVINFANVDWSGCCGATWADREVARLRFAVTKLGYKGLKISKVLGLGVTDEADKLVAVDDVRLDPLWHEAARHHLPVTIHVADPKAFWEPLNPKNERWTELRAHPDWSYHGEDVPGWEALLDAAERMYKRNDKTTFVAVHFGNAGEDPDRVDKMLRTLPNVHIDIAARVGEFGRHAPEKMRKFFIKHQDRIVFGTDIGISDGYLMLGSNGEVEPTDDDVQPFYNAHFRYLEGKERQIAHPSPIQGDWKVDAIALPAPVLQKVYRDNALKLLAKVKPALTVTGSK